MTTAIEYALMAGAAYVSTRPDINKFPVPEGWTDFFHVPNNPDYPQFTSASGFEAISFTNGTEIVISFAGTGPGILQPDWIANSELALGTLTQQLKEAADYYLQVRAQNPGAIISFTGHSLGGGLASLMAVFFGESAFTFDQAPFRASAQGYANDFSSTTDSVAKNLRAYLADHIPVTSLTKLDAYIAALEIFNNPNPIAADTLAAREAKVTDINVQGEILSSWLVPFSRIGSQANIPDSANGVAGTDLHSQALLTAFLQSNQTAAAFQTLSDVTVKLPDLLKMIFDPQLFYYDPNNKDKPKENLLEHLVRHEAGLRDPATGATTLAADAMVTRFTSDLWKLAQDGGMTMGDGNSLTYWNNVSKALTAFAMQKYYLETGQSAGYKKELFTDLTAANEGSNGVRFDMVDVSGTLGIPANSGAKLDLSQFKGYEQYFKNYISTTGGFTAAEQEIIKSMLPVLRDWYVQAGASGMNATDTLNRGAFMLGGNGSDALVGGAAADLLIGNAGADTLQGGQGNDTLLGGTGNDTYKYNAGDGLDTIFDTDSTGIIKIDGVEISGGNQYGDARVHRDTAGHLYVSAGQNLIIDGNILVRNYNPARGNGMGLTLGGPAVEANPVTIDPPIIGDLAPIDFNLAQTGVQTQLDALGNVKTTPGTPEANRADTLYDSAGNDLILGYGGNDTIRASRGGDDIIDAGTGRDIVVDDGGNNIIIIGGADGDVLIGGANSDRLYADTKIGAAKAIALGNLENSGVAQLGDWLAGGTGSDTLVGSTAQDVLMGGADTDLLVGGAGNDYLSGDYNWIPANLDWTVGQQNGNPLLMSVIDNTPATSGAADVIYAGEGDDYAWGDFGNDVLFGENGADKLYGGEGDDILSGGTGNDTLDGGAGRDIYIYNKGDGTDNILEAAGSINNTLRFGEGIGANDVTLRLGSLMLDLGNGDAVHIKNFDQNDVFNSSSISSFVFGDGTTLTTAELLARGFDLDGTAGDGRMRWCLLSANDETTRAWRIAA